MKSLLIRTIAAFSLVTSLSVNAADTVCNNNGGTGWPITDFGTTNLSIPFNFGDVSHLYDINISTDITHTYVGDLTMRVTSPDSGTQVTLFERPGTPDPEFSTPTSFGCNQNDINATFDDQAASGTNVENICTASTPTISGTYLPQDAAPNNLSAYNGENPNGNWGVYLSDSANQDTGTLNQVCITVAYAAATFDKWVSSNASCSDTIDNLAVATGTDVYFCYIAQNPSTETFSINSGGWTDDHGHNLSGLEGTYVQGASKTVVEGPIVAGSASLPIGTTVNNASITASFATANFTGTLVTGETATAVVADPIFSTSTKTVVDLNGGAAEPGDVLEYTVTINETGGVYTPNIQITDVVDANLDSVTITTLPAGATDNTVGNNIDVTGISVPANGSVSLVYQASIGGTVAASTSIDNTATISHAASGVSFDAVAPTVVTEQPTLDTSTKVELDVNGGSAVVGDLIRYTITINETGGYPATNIHLTDTVDPNLTSVTVTSLPGGATNNSTGNSIDITNISVPANGNATVIIEGNIYSGASIGTVISNTANLQDVPSGSSASVSAGTIVVGANPTSGTKQLYLENVNSTQDLTRTVPTATNTSTAAFGGGSSVTFDQTPVFQAPFTITGGSTVNIFLNLQRRNGGGARSAQVDLYNGNTGTLIGSASQGWNAGGTRYLTFPISIASDINFSANDFVRLVVTNTSTNGNNIRVRGLVAGNQSQIQMPSSTVVNIDTVQVYAATYNSIAQYSSYLPGSTVFVRALVSDPFGNADISSSTISITDPTSTVQVNNAAMTAVANPDGASTLYEYQYNSPASPEGFWTLDVTANEGTEGTISHTSQSTMILGTSIINVTKTSQVLSDPVNVSNPKAIPGAIVEYTITVSNSGYGYADLDSIMIDDPLAAQTSFFFGSPVDPAQFTDGATASGLSYTFSSLGSSTDDIDFSSDGGSSFVTPSVDGSGYDTTAPAINFIRINPKGELRGSDGVNNPSFTINYKLKIN